MNASSKVKLSATTVASESAFEPMVDPLHPMHQTLYRRMTETGGAQVVADDDGWSRPTRFAVLFYLGVGTWVGIGGIAYLLSRLI